LHDILETRQALQHVFLRFGQRRHALISAPLGLSKFSHALISAPLGLYEPSNSCFETLETRLGAALGVSKLSHQGRHAQQLLGQHKASELSTPLWMLLKQTYEVVEILYTERHRFYSILHR
jgi:hypothetical protein